MNLISHFGQFLAKELGIPAKSGAVCGFMRIVIKSVYGDKAVDNLTPKMMVKILQGELKQKLAILKVDTLPKAISRTILEVNSNQSLFTMNRA